MISAWDIVGVFGFGFLVGIMLHWVLDGYRIDREAAQNADDEADKQPCGNDLHSDMGYQDIPAFLRRQAD